MKIIIFIILTIILNAESILPPIEINNFIDDASEIYKKAGTKTLRYITNTQTEKEKCNSKWWKLFKSSNKTISNLFEENNEIKRLLDKRHIRYRELIKIEANKVQTDIEEIRKNSCSKKYFKLLMQKTKRIKVLKASNKKYKELLKDNQITYKKISFEKKDYEKKKERKKAKSNLLKQMKEDREMQNAINDVM